MMKRWVKRTAIFIGIITGLLVAFVFFLHTAAGKSLVQQKLENFLEKKWGNAISIGNINYRLPNWILLEKVTIGDRGNDTLLSCGRLYVGIKMLKLLSDVVDVSGLRLEDVSLRCHRGVNDSAFNFQFILDAFAPAEKTKSSKENETPLRFSVKQLSLKRIKLSVTDDSEQLYLSAFINELSIRPGELYPEKNSFGFNDLTLSDSRLTIVDSSGKKGASHVPATTGSETGSLLLALKELKLRNVFFDYHIPYNKTDYAFRVDSLAMHQASLDLSRQLVSAESIWLRNSDVSLRDWLPASSSTQKKQSAATTKKKEWSFAVQSISFYNNSFSYHNNALQETKGLDFQHIDLKTISLQTGQNRIDSSGFYANLDALSLRYNNQLHVKDLNANVHFSDSLLLVRDVKTSINQSQLTTSGDFAWPLQEGVAETDRQFTIENSSISFGDLLLINPGLKKQLPVSLMPSDKIVLSGSFSSAGKKLQGEKINLATSNRGFLYNGNIELLMKKDGPQIGATIQRLTVNKKILPKDLLLQLQNQNIFLPAEITLTGKTQIDAETCIAKLKLNSEFGELLIDGKVRNISSPQRIVYNITLDANDYSPGKLVGVSTVLGKVNGRIFIEGKGLQKNNLAVVSRVHLRSAVINGYSFSNIDLEAELDKSDFIVRSRIDDRNLQTDLELSGVIGRDLSVEGNMQIQQANLFGLGITSDTMIFASNLSVNGNYYSPNRVDAFVQLDSTRFFVGEKQIQTDHLSITCMTDTDTTSMTVQAPFAHVQLGGNYAAKVLPAELMSLWRRLYVFNSFGDEETPVKNTSSRNTWLDAKITQDDVISMFLPELELKQPLTIQGRFHTEQENSFQSVQISTPAVKYMDYYVADLKLGADAADSGTQFSLSALGFSRGYKQFGNTNILGSMQKDLLAVKATIVDSLGKEFYAANVQLKKENDEVVIKLLDDLLLNYNKWKLSPGNSIHIRNEGYVVDNLSMENHSEVIRINSKEQTTAAPIDIKVENFDVGHLFTDLSGDETLRAKGILTADISIQQPIHKIPVVTGDITATNLSVLDIPLGDLHFHSGSIGDSMEVQGELSGANQLGFNGRMHLSNRGIALQAHLQKFNTEIIRSLTKDFFNRLSGKITGDIKVTGSPDSLMYQGVAYIDSTEVSLTAFNTPYRLDRQRLIIDYPALRFEKFSLTDSAGHPLTVQGNVNFFDPLKKSMDLNIETKDFIALQTSRQPHTLLYGTAIVDAALDVKGTIDEPIIEGNAGLQGKSNVFVISSPKRNYSSSRKNGIIFVKMDTLTSIDTNIAEESDSIITQEPVKGLKYNLALTVDKEAAFSVIVNPATGDELVMKGDARLRLGLSKNGKTGIEGVYNLQSGYYKMNNLLLRGKFNLVKGSSISFNGDPDKAEPDVTTEYIVDASPKALLNYTDDDNSEYSQRVPFAVVLMVKGTVAKPVLSFDIQLRPGKAILKSSVKSDIEHALNRLRSDVTEMNKQVFSLLLAKRFSSTTADNTLESSNLNANNALKEGVSSFLTEAMDQVADQLIKNVDVDVSMKTYKTDNDPVSKTDLGVAMSKDLFQDRLVIRIEESFAMGDQSSYPVKSGSQYIPDITSTYKLSKDGRFQLKAYNKNEYDAVVQGYFTEVGINFTIELSYDKFQELMRRRKSEVNNNK